MKEISYLKCFDNSEQFFLCFHFAEDAELVIYSPICTLFIQTSILNPFMEQTFKDRLQNIKYMK